MSTNDTIFIGIDPTSGHNDFSYAALDKDLNLLALGDASGEELVEFLAGYQAVTAAINAPSHVNVGLLRKKLEDQSPIPGHSFRGVDIRLVEYELRVRGISVSGTPAREESCQPWVQLGLALYRTLTKKGFQPFKSEGAEMQWLETNPNACFCVMLEQAPFPKPTLEGRLQRQAILYDHGLQIKDPMDFFEEITRYKLKKGILPLELVYSPEQLDTLVAAYTAWAAEQKQGEVIVIGDWREGSLVLPTKALKERY